MFFHFAFCSQVAEPNTRLQYIPNALLSHSNIMTGIFKEDPISRGQITQVPPFSCYIAKVRKTHSYTHHRLTFRNTPPLPPLAFCCLWKVKGLPQLARQCCPLSPFNSTHKHCDFIANFLLNYKYCILERFDTFFFPCFLCWPVPQLPTLSYMSPNWGQS